MEYQKSSNLDPNARLEISRIFVEGFYEWFKYFSKDKNKLTAAFSDAFVWEKFYVAMENGKIIGIAALTNGIETVVITNKKTLRKHLGFIRGGIAKFFLKKEFEKHSYPFDMCADTDSIEFIAVDKDCRGKNIAGGLLDYIAQNSSKNRFVLEVASSNTSAIRAYEKFGFVEFFTINLSSKEQKYAGFEKYIYMEYIKQSVPKK
ncbi:MAG: GNAT family N-acetyltransferase [Spirochaetia bacterium]|nr:GNAT family N-acetyltransferase [Spirochaetia bacterium]